MKRFVFHQNNCIQCKMTMKMWDEAGVGYDHVNIDEEPAYREQLKAQGFQSLPVVMIDDGETAVWTGFRPDKIREFS